MRLKPHSVNASCIKLFYVNKKRLQNVNAQLGIQNRIKNVWCATSHTQILASTVGRDS